MKEKMRFAFSVFWVLVGAVLVGLGVAEVIDSYWSGMGGGLMGVGILQTIRHIRYRKDPEYREKMDTENKDEHNRFIGGKAWAWAGYLFVFIEALLVIVFKLMGREELMMMASFNVCGILLLYWLCWLFLKRKY